MTRDIASGSWVAVLIPSTPDAEVLLVDYEGVVAETFGESDSEVDS